MPNQVSGRAIVIIAVFLTLGVLAVFLGRRIFGGEQGSKPIELKDGDYAVIMKSDGTYDLAGKGAPDDHLKEVVKALVGDVFEDLKTAKADLKESEENVVERDREIAVKANEISRNSAEIVSLNGQVATLRADVLRLRETNTVLQGQHEADVKALEAEKLRYAKLSAQLAMKKSEYAGEVSEVKRLELKIANLKRVNSGLQSKVKALSASNATLKSQAKPVPAIKPAHTKISSCKKPVVVTKSVYRGIYGGKVQKGIITTTRVSP